MGLQEYKRKRDFRITAEPAGKVGRRASRRKLSFVIQKHAATRLHYDLRLELDGVLKSWAVPKGPSFDPHEKRLAVEVEDHPLDYATFEGTIPEGEYGAGDVIVWDRGTWEPLGDPHRGLSSGKLDFELSGKKLAGRWTLVRTRGRVSGDKNNWLLFKRSDKHARPQSEYDITIEEPQSVKSGRRLSDEGKIEPKRRTASAKRKGVAKKRAIKRLAKKKATARVAPSHARRGKRRAGRSNASSNEEIAQSGPSSKLPDFIVPQLATLASQAPAGPGWVHEIKLDGYRMLCRLEKGKARLITRNGQDWTHRYPAISQAASRLSVDAALLDGEVCALLPSGVTSFQALQNAGRNGATAQLVYYSFDLLHLNGHDVRPAPLSARKELLRELLDQVDSPVIQFSDHFDENGPAFLRQSCRLGLEGIISKRIDRPYVSGRTYDWIKSKCQGREELVIGGFTLSDKMQRGIGALLVGYFDGGSFRYAGRVGTGFTAQTLLDLRQRLAKLRQDERPFEKVPAKELGRSVSWVRPHLVAEVEFTGWTDGGVLRHPSFQGLREDKLATEVTRPASLRMEEEKPMPAPAAKHIRKRKSAKKSPNRSAGKPAKREAAAVPDLNVELTNPQRVLWPDIGLTKLGLATFYSQIADWILPHLIDRPLSMLRCPEGNKAGKCFYQKHAMPGTPKALARVPVQESDGIGDYLAVRDLDGLMALVQTSILEIHPWGSRRDRLDNPDRIIIDLDPDEGLPWQRVIDAVYETRDLFDEMGLVSFLKTTGGKGLHVVVPISPRRHNWDEVKQFARSVAEKLVARSPSQYVANMSKAARRGKIFVDYLRNDHGSTAIAAYSTRAKAGAPVSTPLHWDELSTELKSNHFTVQNLQARLRSLKKDPWAAIDSIKQTLPKAR